MLIDIYKIPLLLMILHAFMAAVWNVAGLVLISQEQSSQAKG